MCLLAWAATCWMSGDETMDEADAGSPSLNMLDVVRIILADTIRRFVHRSVNGEYTWKINDSKGDTFEAR